MPAPVDDEPEVELDGWEDEADRRYDDSREERTHGPDSAVDDEIVSAGDGEPSGPVTASGQGEAEIAPVEASPAPAAKPAAASLFD